MLEISSGIATRFSRLYNPGAQSVRFLNNHDTVRVASQLDDEKREKLAATLLMTLPGTPMVYYGEEIGMRGDKTDGDKSVRLFASTDGTTWTQGALIYGTVQIGILYTGIDSDLFKVFLGLMVLLAVLFNNYVRRRATQER